MDTINTEFTALVANLRKNAIKNIKSFFKSLDTDHLDLDAFEKDNGIPRIVLDSHEKDPINYIDTLICADGEIRIQYETSVPFELAEMYEDDIPTDILCYLADSVRQIYEL